MKLVDIVQQDVHQFLTKNQELMFNERDFQMHLAVFLRETRKYDDVDVEYYVPYKALNNYIWESELRLDILVRKGNEYLPVELKYKTKRVTKGILRFEEKLTNIEVLKNQGAQDLGMYDFWKDVRRIELVRKRFNAVKNGLAVFVTNDSQYLKPSRETSNNKAFNMNAGVHGKQKHWKDSNSTCARTHGNFEVEKEYSIDWSESVYEDVKFYYCIVQI